MEESALAELPTGGQLKLSGLLDNLLAAVVLVKEATGVSVVVDGVSVGRGIGVGVGLGMGAGEGEMVGDWV